MEPHDGSTEVSYDVDLELSGRLATFGAPLLREVMRGQVTELVRNLEREVARDRAGPPP
jgi:carbon monoxide dehydrogenase subunit G